MIDTTITSGTYGAVHDFLSLAAAAMLAGTLFFFFSRAQVGFKYRPALLVSALVTAIACYHYFRIFNSWIDAHQLNPDGSYGLTKLVFNDAYRYMDWILTVPLLLVELVAVLGLPKAKSRGLLIKLALAAFLMIALGYPGETQTNLALRLMWGALSMIPFTYIQIVLFSQLNDSIAHQPKTVVPLIQDARVLIIASWCFYPIAYIFPLIGSGISYSATQLGVQIGYTVADIVAKVGLGIFIYFIAVAKTENDVQSGINPFEPNLKVATVTD